MTVQQQLEKLPDVFKEKALRNMKECEKRMDMSFSICEVNNISDAISAAFVWHYTPEGQNYWQDVYSHFLTT